MRKRGVQVAAVVGRGVRLSGAPFVIVGVARRGFHLPGEHFQRPANFEGFGHLPCGNLADKRPALRLHIQQIPAFAEDIVH